MTKILSLKIDNYSLKTVRLEEEDEEPRSVNAAGQASYLKCRNENYLNEIACYQNSINKIQKLIDDNNFGIPLLEKAAKEIEEWHQNQAEEERKRAEGLLPKKKSFFDKINPFKA